jgi:dolichol-phosphate mannosyltransferase
LPTLEPMGFKLLLEILAKAPGAQVMEVPIIFVGRRRGQSKLSRGDVFAFLRSCLRLRRL